MSAPVDVLALLDGVSVHLRINNYAADADRLREASAAVAELIEAATDCVEHGNRGAVTRGRAEARVARLRLALACVRGV